MNTLRVTLRDWQNNFINAVMNSKNGINANIVTGAGKTLGALAAYEQALVPRYKKPFILIGVPKVNIVNGWIRSARKFTDLRLAEGLGKNQFIPGKHDGIVMTYPAMRTKKLEIQKLCSNYDVIVIRDEAQWLGENKWGDVFERITSNAVFHIALTGTPFRTVEDDQLIGYQYQNGQAISDFNYDYSQALSDGIVPEIRWATLGGVIEWQEERNGKLAGSSSRFGEDEELTDEGHYVHEKTLNKRLSMATYAGPQVLSPYLTDLLQEGHRSLLNARRNHPDAGGVIFSQSIAAANAITQFLRHSGQQALVVHGEVSDPVQVINDFRDSNVSWLVSCEMLREGTDIPRLRTAIMASTMTTPRQTLQMVGRLLRLDITLGDQVCEVVAPADPRIVRVLESFGAGIPLRKPVKGRKPSGTGTGSKAYTVPVSIDADDVTVELTGTLGTSSKQIKLRSEKFRTPFIDAEFVEDFNKLPIHTLLAFEKALSVIASYAFTTLPAHIHYRNELAIELVSETNLPKKQCQAFIDILMRSVDENTKLRTLGLPVGADVMKAPIILATQVA